MRSFFKPFTRGLCVVLAVWFSQAGSAEESTPANPTAKQIIDRMAKTYADCESYRDSGLVKTVFISSRGERVSEKPFSTAFIRPDRFRFEYYENKGGLIGKCRYIVWRDDKEVKTKWDIRPGIKKPESLGMALAGATGVSSGSAHTIPALLMADEVCGRRLTDMTDARRIEDDKLGKVDCFRIRAKYAKRPMTVWIDKKSFLIRRIDGRNEFDDFRTEDTTTYDPVINAEITDQALEFEPPKRSARQPDRNVSSKQ